MNNKDLPIKSEECNIYPRCRNEICQKIKKERYEEDNTLYCNIRSEQCDDDYLRYKQVCSCITRITEVVVNKGYVDKCKRSRDTTAAGKTYIKEYRPIGGYLRYALFMNDEQKQEYYDCILNCINTREKHHEKCMIPKADKRHRREIDYLEDCLEHCRRSVQQIAYNVFINLMKNYDSSVIELSRIKKLISLKQIVDKDDDKIVDELEKSVKRNIDYLIDASDDIFCNWSNGGKCFIPIQKYTSEFKAKIQNDIIHPLIIAHIKTVPFLSH